MDTSLLAEKNPVVASYISVTFPLLKASTLKDQSKMGRSRLTQIGLSQFLKLGFMVDWRSPLAENFQPHPHR
ncbi:hypothetical protein [Sphaerothrix gracilis]|uniref:hypothetical protein n=1 Tax=Sphaerothrix gracilis TaxID=3151835 RepID=UPI0031FD925E